MAKVTLADIAERAHVSKATVSRVLNGRTKIREELRVAVFQAASELGYATNPRIVAFVVPDSENPFFLGLRAPLQGKLEEAGYHLVIASSDGQPERELRLLEYFRRTGVSGIFFICDRDVAALLSAMPDDLPIVVLDRALRSNRFDYLSTDNKAGASIAVQHLLDNGHQQIGFIGGLAGTSTALERRAGYLEALRGHGLEVTPEWRWEGDFQLDSGEAAAQAFITLQQSKRPTAVFAANDLMAIGFLRGVQRAGIDVPTEVSVVGFDNIGFAGWCFPELTTVEQPAQAIASEATDFMLERIDEQKAARAPRPARAVRLAPTLIERDSVTKVRETK